MNRFRTKAESDVEVRHGDGVFRFEVKRQRGGDVEVYDLVHHTEMRVSSARPIFVGAASMFGWYVRSQVPWLEHGDNTSLYADWQIVGDDLWRAAAHVAGNIKKPEPAQSRLFDPADTGKRSVGRT